MASSIYVLNAAQAEPGQDPDKKFDWILKPEAYFSYLQYLEFRHAIRAANQSNRLSFIALAVAVISVIIAITFGR